MMFLFRVENCYKPATYFALNKSSSTEEVNVLINEQDIVVLEAMGGGFTWGASLIRW